MTAEANDIPADPDVRNVLVPVDGSELSLRAMPTARELARRFRAALHIVSVARSGEDATRLRNLGTALLGAERTNDRVVVVTEGDPAQVIAQRAKELGSCVVCMSTHGRGRLRGAVVGSVARAVLQASPDPIVALGPSADNPGWSPKPRNWPEPLSVPRLVACVDGTELSEQVLPVAASWARALGMTLTILTVAPDVPSPFGPESEPSRYGAHTDARSYIDELVSRWASVVADVDGEVVRDPISPASGLRSHLDRRPAGLVAVTTRARSGVQRLRLGAEAAGIVHASLVPCLVVPLS